MKRLVQPQKTDYGVVCQLIHALCARYSFFSAAPIGQSVVGRAIVGLTLGDGDERALMAAAFHGQEWLTALICLRLCEDIGEAYDTNTTLDGWDIRRALRDRTLMWVPLVNPDGVEIALHGSVGAGSYSMLVNEAGGDIAGRWQANARGVDINHNFNAGFETLQQIERKSGICGPCARQWGGPYPESEPETQAMVRLCRNVDFRQVTALHSQGEEIYWQYGKRTPPSAELIASVMAVSSGYTVAAPGGLAGHGGFKDWFIESTGRPGFTIELGRGQNPLPLADFEEIYRKAREMLLIALLI